MNQTLLQQTLKMPNLRRAWDEIADNSGIAGVDNVSIRRWRRNWEERLVKLAAEVRGNRYRPGRLRTRRIPKTNRREWRVLRIPTVTDRVLQRAVLQRLYPICEAHFLKCSYGYRPGRGLRDAVRAINAWRKRGYIWVLDADIDDFFNQVDHPLLRQFVAEDLPDASLMPLINLWLKAGRAKADVARGIPMGSPLSPLLANIYLHRLDQALIHDGYPLIRYADDFVVLNTGRRQAENCCKVVQAILARLKLRYEPHKTQITSFDQGFDFLGVHFEETWYWYIWGDKRVEVRDGEADWLLPAYGPDY